MPSLVSGLSNREQTVASSAKDADKLTQFEDASSQKNGKWYGLCQKRSVQSLEDFRRTVENDPALSVYYAGFNWEEAKLGNLKEDVMAYVAHREGDVIKKTAKPIKLPKGDGYITDGVRTARTYCCNDIDLTPSAGNPNPSPPLGALPPAAPLAATPALLPPASGPRTTTSSFPLPPIVPWPGTHYSEPPSPTPPAPPTPAVPEPGTLLLMSVGLLALAAFGRKK
ncbi:MAG: PEP-CTERM sorting domain-containing protein [Desulfobulbus sp.]|nr:PEP-CTERM sorting domain-containing protein [Desulfobulbus sp.]